MNYCPQEARCTQGTESWARSPGINVQPTIRPFPPRPQHVTPTIGGLDRVVSAGFDRDAKVEVVPWDQST